MEDSISDKKVQAIWEAISGIPCPFRGKRAEFFDGEKLKGKLELGDKENICALMFSGSSALCFSKNGNIPPCLGSLDCPHNHSAGREMIAKFMLNFIVLDGGEEVSPMEWLQNVVRRNAANQKRTVLFWRSIFIQ